MKTYLLFGLVFILPLLVLGHVSDEQLSVVSYMIRKTVLAPGNTDYYDGNEPWVAEEPYPTYESLFEEAIPSGRPGSDWTPAQRRAAYESFLMDIPWLAQTNVMRNLRYHVEHAMQFSLDRHATNMLAVAKNILATPCNVGLIDAIHIFNVNTVPSEEMNAFVELAITNRLTSTYAEEIAGDYVGKIHKSLGTLDGAVVTNGTRMLLRVRQGDYSAVQLDKLLLDVYPEYASSSNRLELSERTLRTLVDDTIFCDKSIRPYFDAVTNQLHGATQPLPEVEALRGL